MFIRTERLFLRPGWPEDLDDLIEALGDDALVRSVAALPDTIEDLRDYLARPRKGLLPHLFIYSRETDEPTLVGGIGLARSGEEIELGYWIARRHRGQGFAGEAVRAVLEQAQTLGQRRIVAAPFADDEASERMLERSGFIPADIVPSEIEPRGEGAPAPRVYVAVLAETLADGGTGGSQPLRA